MKEMNQYKDYICAVGNNAELERIRGFVLERALGFGFDASTAQKITLAVDEACSNLIRHSYNFDTSKEICIAIDNVGKEFIINIFDEGKEFNPISEASPDMTEYFKSFKRGGLGIHIIKLIMDEISYKPKVGDSPNQLCLKKYLP